MNRDVVLECGVSAVKPLQPPTKTILGETRIDGIGGPSAPVRSGLVNPGELIKRGVGRGAEIEFLAFLLRFRISFVYLDCFGVYMCS